MVLSVAADAVASRDVIIQFLLELAGDSVAVNGGIQVGPFQSLREYSRAFVGGAFASLVYLADFLGGACIEFAFGFGGGRAFVPWAMLVGGLGGVCLKELSDRCLDTSEGRGGWNTGLLRALVSLTSIRNALPCL